MKNQAIRWFLVSALATFLLVGCSGEKPQAGAGMMGGGGMQALPVAVMPVATKKLKMSLEFPGRIVSSNKIIVKAKVAGTLVARKYVEGTEVKRGDLLFIIDPDKYQSAKNMAQAAFNNANREYKRAKELFAEEAISQKELDQAEANFESAKAALDNANLDLSYTKVVAPFDGFAGTRTVDVGNLISVGTELTTITDLNPLHVEFAFADMEKIKENYSLEGASWDNPTTITVNLKSQSGKSYPHSGKIDFLDRVVDSKSGSVKARALVANDDLALMPGQFVRVVLGGLIREEGVEIPQSAVMQGPQGAFVYTVVDGKATVSPIVIAQESGKSFIINEGLKVGDSIILNNLVKIRPGMPVAPMAKQ